MKRIEIGVLLTIVLPMLACVGVEPLFPYDLAAKSDLIVLSEVVSEHEHVFCKTIEVWKGKAVPPLELDSDASDIGKRFVIFAARREEGDYSWNILGMSPISKGEVLFQGGLSQGHSTSTVIRVTSFSVEDFRSIIKEAIGIVPSSLNPLPQANSHPTRRIVSP